jgi:hypothetical protein
MKLHVTIATLISCVLATSAMTDRAAAAQPPKGEQREFARQFLRMCDLAAAELQKPITPFADRKSTDSTSHHMPFFEDAHAVRALCVAYDRTGDLKYLSACQRWSDQMVAFQDRMIPAGAYYMNHSRAPGQDRGQWNVADSGTIAMGVLATAVRSAHRDPKRRETYLRSVKAFAKLVMDNYIGPEGGITNGHWSGYAGQWWCSTATAGSLLLLLYEETGEERYLRAGRAALEWMVRQDFRQAKPITFQQRPSGIIFYCFELYAIGLRHLTPDSPSYRLAQGQIAEAVAWMKEHPIKQVPGDWEIFDIHSDIAGLPYLKLIFARELSQYRQLSITADEDLARIAGWLFSRGDPPVSRLIPWEVMSWGMLSFAERLSPGLLFRASQSSKRQHSTIRRTP